MSIQSICVNTLPERPECPDHLDYTIQFPVPKSEINTLRRFTDKVEKLFGVKVVLTAVVPGIVGEEAQELIQVSSKHRDRDEAEKAEEYCENLCKGRYQECIICPTRYYDKLRPDQERIEKESRVVVVLTKESEILVQGSDHEKLMDVKRQMEELVAKVKQEARNEYA
ncbi:uncharacterized protein LOC142345058 [Convolutriloba macropyga]|uniref:uncharacterized protein LOC142345058 n=1 Tax=Convolutriloba macropyga TaxID=536237 RepID=UPI003F5246B5